MGYCGICCSKNCRVANIGQAGGDQPSISPVIYSTMPSQNMKMRLAVLKATVSRCIRISGEGESEIANWGRMRPASGFGWARQKATFAAVLFVSSDELVGLGHISPCSPNRAAGCGGPCKEPKSPLCVACTCSQALWALRGACQMASHKDENNHRAGRGHRSICLLFLAAGRSMS